VSLEIKLVFGSSLRRDGDIEPFLERWLLVIIRESCYRNCK